MRRLQIFLPVLLLALLLTACGAPKQSIPISTNPLGAVVFADGIKACTTPCSISLSRTSEHLLTIVKPGFEQVDMTVSRQFRPDKPLRDAALGAILSGKDPKEAAAEAAKEVDEQEKSGEAYELVPSMIQVKLEPLAGE